MYLRNLPQTFVKNGKRRLAYYSAEARDLTSLGWVAESKPAKRSAQTAKEVEPKLSAAHGNDTISGLSAEPQITSEQPAKVEVDVIVENIQEDAKKLPDFEFMTKVELLQYASDRGVDLPNNALKAELIEACKKL